MKKQYLFIDGYNLLFRMKEYELIKSSTFPAERDRHTAQCPATGCTIDKYHQPT